MAPQTARWIEVGVVVVGVAALLLWVPQRWFHVLAMAMLVLSVLAVLGLKKYMDGLHARAESLDSAGSPDEATVLRVRRIMLIDLGVAFAIVGLTSFIALIVVYGD